MGRAASELIRRGVRYQLGTRKLNGLPVFDAPDDFPAITDRTRAGTAGRGMNRHLLDVNVLLALVWPRHESHDAAHAWFAKSGHNTRRGERGGVLVTFDSGVKALAPRDAGGRVLILKRS